MAKQIQEIRQQTGLLWNGTSILGISHVTSNNFPALSPSSSAALIHGQIRRWDPGELVEDEPICLEISLEWIRPSKSYCWGGQSSHDCLGSTKATSTSDGVHLKRVLNSPYKGFLILLISINFYYIINYDIL